MRLFLSALLAFGLAMSAVADTEEPAHTIILEDGKRQIRQYAPKIVAEVEVSGSQSRASNAGFRTLADFIFGNNTAKTEIAMTAPVTQTASEEIAMTAPVTQTQAGEDRWTVGFVMPSKWTMETLPTPNNPDVKIRQIAPEMLAVIRFNGRGRAAKQARKQAELEAWIAEQNYQITGPATAAFYDPPWTLPPFRRNEVMIPVTPKDEQDKAG